MTREKVLNPGQVAIAYDLDTNQCFEGQVVGKQTTENSRARYLIYLLSIDGKIKEFPFYQVFVDQDLDEEKLELQHPTLFSINAQLNGIDIKDVEKTITQALITLG